MKKLMTIVLLFYSVILWAQEKEKALKMNNFQIDLGHQQAKEANLHGKVHGGVLYGLSYEHQRLKKNLSGGGVGFQYSRLQTKYESLSATMNIQLMLNYFYAFQVFDKKKIRVYLGPELKLHYNLSMYPNWDESHLYWADQLNLGVYAKATYQLKETSSLSGKLVLPVIALFSRPELYRKYKIDDVSVGGVLAAMHSNLEVGTWNRVFCLQAELEYRFNIRKKMAQGICYTFRYARLEAKDGRPYENIQHNLGLKIYF